MSDKKLAKSTVKYGPGMRGSRCDICVHWEPPKSCEIVAGRIEPGDWCDRFKKAAAKRSTHGT